jgi:predicted glycosyltransferase
MGTRLVRGLPEVLGGGNRVRADWSGGSYDVLRRHYDAVWVYGDRNVLDPVEHHGMPRDIARMVRHTGYLGGDRPGPGAADRERAPREEHRLGDGPVCVCLASDSDEDVRLAETFARTPLPAGTTGVVRTGPSIAVGDRARPDQLVRAERLADLGAVDLMLHGHLTPAALTAWLAGGPRPPEALAGAIDTDGLRRLPTLLDELAPPRRAGGPPPARAAVVAAPSRGVATAAAAGAGAGG